MQPVKADGGRATLRGTTHRGLSFTRVVSVDELAKENGDVRRLTEKVEIKCVLYADGTWWRQPGVAPEECVKPQRPTPLSDR